MKTGIIGAGRVGCSLGKYFRSKNADLVGYYDTNAAAAKEAAAFTQTADFDQKRGAGVETISSSPRHPPSPLILKRKKKQKRHLPVSGKMSSFRLSDSKHNGVSCCSVHPMLPFSNKFSSYQQLEHAFLP